MEDNELISTFQITDDQPNAVVVDSVGKMFENMTYISSVMGLLITATMTALLMDGFIHVSIYSVMTPLMAASVFQSIRWMRVAYKNRTPPSLKTMSKAYKGCEYSMLHIGVLLTLLLICIRYGSGMNDPTIKASTTVAPIIVSCSTVLISRILFVSMKRRSIISVSGEDFYVVPHAQDISTIRARNPKPETNSEA